MDSCTLEYIIKPPKDWKTAIYRVLTIIGVIILFTSSLILSTNLLPPFLLPGAALLSLSVSVALGFFLWRMISVEYEIAIGNNEISVVKIMGKSWRRALIDLPISQITELGDYDDNAYEKLSKKMIEKTLICVSSFSAPQILYALFEFDGRLGILCFEADERAITKLKSLNPRAFRQGTNK